MNKLAILSRVVAFSTLLSMTVIAGESNPVTGVYSNLQYHESSGDLSGMEIFIFDSNDGYYVTYQCASGEVAAPVLLRARIVRSEIEFDVPDSFKFFCGYGTFTGKISPTGIVGKFMGRETDVHLERRLSYWQ